MVYRDSTCLTIITSGELYLEERQGTILSDSKTHRHNFVLGVCCLLWFVISYDFEMEKIGHMREEIYFFLRKGDIVNYKIDFCYWYWNVSH